LSPPKPNRISTKRAGPRQTEEGATIDYRWPFEPLIFKQPFEPLIFKQRSRSETRRPRRRARPGRGRAARARGPFPRVSD
jgi:hypothetical protein